MKIGACSRNSERNGVSRRYDSVLAQLSLTETVFRTPHPTLSHAKKPREPAAQEGRGDKFSDRRIAADCLDWTNKKRRSVVLRRVVGQFVLNHPAKAGRLA